MTDTTILTERRGHVLIVTINRPEARNAVNAAVHIGIGTALEEAENDSEIRAVVITGAGDKSFCAGADLVALSRGESLQPDDPAQQAWGFAGMVSHPISKPVIAAVNGVAITGGFELALACGILVASTTARFADTHQRVGVIPGWGLSQKLSRIVGPSRAKEMAFSGRFVSAEQASQWGLVSRAVPPEALMADVMTLAGEIAEVPAAFLADYKRLVDEGYGMPFAEAMALEADWSKRHNSAIAVTDLEARRAGVQARGRSR